MYDNATTADNYYDDDNDDADTGTGTATATAADNDRMMKQS